MTFRTRLLLIFTLAVVAAVALVESVVSAAARRRFQEVEAQRAGDLVAQFRAEFQRRGEEIAHEVNGIASSDAAVQIAMAPDTAPYYGEAASLAAAHGLGLLELVAGDGAIISSAEWPARFGYHDDWVTQGAWKPGRAALRREELPEGFTLALSAVGAATAGDRKLYVVGGQQLDRGFLSTLVLPAGMRVLLYRNLEPDFSAGDLLESGPGATPAQVALLRPLIERVRRDARETGATLGSGAEAATWRALPLSGAGGELLGVLLIASSSRELAQLESFLRWTGIIVSLGGIGLGIALSWWATAR
ncbi:MAG TPA: hypothetical protein VMU19_04305, partial [Bryobacteraceae bacterium]|nr:hypothetical protein [Bryobacteraceae bacterium]